MCSAYVPLKEFRQLPISPQTFSAPVPSRKQSKTASAKSLQRKVRRKIGGVNGGQIITSSSHYVKYRAYVTTYVRTRSVPNGVTTPHLHIAHACRVSTPITYRRYRSTPYTGTYPANTLFFSPGGRHVNIGRSGYVNYGDYIVTYPFNTIDITAARIPILVNSIHIKSRAGDFILGYSLYISHPNNPTYTRTYPAGNLALISRRHLTRLATRHTHTAVRGRTWTSNSEPGSYRVDARCSMTRGKEEIS